MLSMAGNMKIIIALSTNPMTMKDWIEALDNQIIAHKWKVLIGKGNISHKQAIEKAKKSSLSIANVKWSCWKVILIRKSRS